MINDKHINSMTEMKHGNIIGVLRYSFKRIKVLHYGLKYKQVILFRTGPSHPSVVIQSDHIRRSFG